MTRRVGDRHQNSNGPCLRLLACLPCLAVELSSLRAFERSSLTSRTRGRGRGTGRRHLRPWPDQISSSAVPSLWCLTPATGNGSIVTLKLSGLVVHRPDIPASASSLSSFALSLVAAQGAAYQLLACLRPPVCRYALLSLNISRRQFPTSLCPNRCAVYEQPLPAKLHHAPTLSVFRLPPLLIITTHHTTRSTPHGSPNPTQETLYPSAATATATKQRLLYLVRITVLFIALTTPFIHPTQFTTIGLPSHQRPAFLQRPYAILYTQTITSAGCHTVDPHTQIDNGPSTTHITWAQVGERSQPLPGCEAKHDLYTKASPSTRSLRIAYRRRRSYRANRPSALATPTDGLYATRPSSRYRRLGGRAIADGSIHRRLCSISQNSICRGQQPPPPTIRFTIALPSFGDYYSLCCSFLVPSTPRFRHHG